MIDLRVLFLSRDGLEAAADAFWQIYRNEPPFQLGAIELAGVPLLTALLMRAPPERGRVTGFFVRKERKRTGLGKLIEGNISDLPIVFVDDIFNSGSSLEKARVALGAVNRKLSEIFVLIDYRSRKGLQWWQHQDIKVRSLFTLADFDLKLTPAKPAPSQSYRILWRSDVAGGNPYHIVPKSAPLLIGDRIFRGCDAGKMHAINAASGELIWEHKATGAAPSKGIWSSPAHADGRIYYGAYNGVVYALDAVTGKEIWTQSLCEWIGASPLVLPEHGLVYIGLEFERPWARGALTALDINTGAKVWEVLIEKLQHGSPCYWRKGDLLIWGSADHTMLGLKAKTGEVVWSFPTRRSVKYAPAIDETRGLVAFASFDKSIYVLDAATGEKRGEWLTDDICYTTPLFANGRLFCGSGDRHLYVIDIESGALLAKLDFGARIYASPVLVDGRVVFSTCGGKMIELDPVSLEIKGLLQLPDAITNAVAASEDGKRIYISTYMNQLYGVERLMPKTD